jgi:hypothetical protein
MKLKQKLLLTLLLAAGAASAQTLSIGYTSITTDAGAQESRNSLSVRGIKLATSSLSGDIGYSATTKEASNALSNRIELGVSNSVKLGDFRVGARVATGWKLVSNKETTSYYAIEPFVGAVIPNTPLDVRVGYRWRDAYSSDVSDSSNTARLAVGYKLSKKDRLTLGYDKLTGNGAGTQTTVAYSRTF